MTRINALGQFVEIALFGTISLVALAGIVRFIALAI